MQVQPIPKPQHKRKVEKVQKIKMQERRECWVTHQTGGLHKHHIFFGNGKRELSEKYGLFVWLRADWHNMSDYGVHFNPALDLELKQEGQRRFQEVYGRDGFYRIFGRYYT